MRKESLEESLVVPVSHSQKLVHIKDIKLHGHQRNSIGSLKQGHCRVFMAKAKHKGFGGYTMSDGKTCPRPSKGCDKYKVCLCEVCFEQCDHSASTVKSPNVVVDWIY